MKIKQIALAAAVGIGILGSGLAHAVTTYGQVVEIYQTATTTYIYVKPSNFGPIVTYVYYCTTTDPELAQAAVASLHKNISLMRCSATTWPTNNGARFGGTLQEFYMN